MAHPFTARHVINRGQPVAKIWLMPHHRHIRRLGTLGYLTLVTYLVSETRARPELTVRNSAKGELASPRSHVWTPITSITSHTRIDSANKQDPVLCMLAVSGQSHNKPYKPSWPCQETRGIRRLAPALPLQGWLVWGTLQRLECLKPGNGGGGAYCVL